MPIQFHLFIKYLKKLGFMFFGKIALRERQNATKFENTVHEY